MLQCDLVAVLVVTFDHGTYHYIAHSGSPHDAVSIFLVYISNAKRLFVLLYILSNNRVWFNCCGLVDVITYDITTSEDQPQVVKQNQVNIISHSIVYTCGMYFNSVDVQMQQTDLVALGQLILCLCCQSLMAMQPENFAKSIQHVSRNFSPDMLKIIQYVM